MAEVRISDLQERADIDLTDFFAVDNATSTRKLAMTTLLSHIADDYQTKTDNSLETTDKTVVGAINELENRISSNGIGDRISLIDYVNPDYYTFPSDGYLVYGANNDDHDIQITLKGSGSDLSYINLAANYIQGGVYGQENAVFVRKGMRAASRTQLISSLSFYFNPISYN